MSFVVPFKSSFIVPVILIGATLTSPTVPPLLEDDFSETFIDFNEFFIGETIPPFAKRGMRLSPFLIESNIARLFGLDTCTAGITYSLFDSHARFESLVPVPVPRTTPPLR